MKILYLSCRDNDYLATCLLHGLMKVVGGYNVKLAQPMTCLYESGTNPCSRIVWEPKEACENTVWAISVMSDQDRDFDLMVVNACFLRDRDWSFVIDMLPRLRERASIAYVEGWDDCGECRPVPPEILESQVTSGMAFRWEFFRREVKPGVAYLYGRRESPREVHCLPMAAPPHWFGHAGENDRHERWLDVFYAGAVMASPERWDCLSRMFQTEKRWNVIAASCGTGFATYFDYFRSAKLAVLPVGAGGCFDCLRTWEAVSHGALPVFVGWPERVREPWFSQDVFWVAETVDRLPGLLDYVLGLPDLEERRTMMLKEAWERHTTISRAKRMLEIAGVKI